MHCRSEPCPIVIIQTPGAYPVLVQTANRAEHAHGQLRTAHFHGEYGYRQTLLNRDMLTDVQGKRGFTHRGTTRHNNQVARLHAGRHTIQIDKATRNAGNFTRVVLMIQLVNTLYHFGQQVGQGIKAFGTTRSIFGYRKNF
jgi:hypothetical protein